MRNCIKGRSRVGEVKSTDCSSREPNTDIHAGKTHRMHINAQMHIKKGVITALGRLSENLSSLKESLRRIMSEILVDNSMPT